MSPPERTRVLRIIGRLNVGGPAWQVTTLATRLDPERYDHRLLAGFVSPGELDYVDLRGVDVDLERVDGLGRSVRPLADLRAFWSIARTIRAFRPHIVHTHTAKAGVLGRVAARLLRVPVVVHTFHGHVLHGYFSPAATRAIVLTERVLARWTTELVAVGDRVRDDLVAAGIGSAEKFTVIAPGVDLPEPPPPAEARHQLGLPADALVVALVARLTTIKRVDRYLDVARRFRSRPDVIFLVAGGGELLDELQEAARDLPAVRFTGWRRDVETVYAAADVVMLTSDNEGMPVSLIEAAAAGCPAVTTDVGSAREVVADGETGFVVPASVDHLSQALARLLDDAELRARLGNAAEDRAELLFRADHLIDATDRLYQRL